MSHRASSYFLSNTSLTAVDKMWRTRVNSEEKVSSCCFVGFLEIQHLLTLFFIFHDTQKTKLPKRVPNPITHEGYEPLRQPRPKPTTAAGLGAASALGGYTNRKQERQQNKLHSQNPQHSCNQYQNYLSLPAHLPTFQPPQSRCCIKPIQSVDYHQGII